VRREQVVHGLDREILQWAGWTLLLAGGRHPEKLCLAHLASLDPLVVSLE
jgi:hypothetical protein